MCVEEGASLSCGVWTAIRTPCSRLMHEPVELGAVQVVLVRHAVRGWTSRSRDTCQPRQRCPAQRRFQWWNPHRRLLTREEPGILVVFQPAARHHVTVMPDPIPIPQDLAAAMLQGYSEGLFAMADENGCIGWYDPDPRAILGPSGVHVSRSLRRALRGRFDVRFNYDPEAVIRACAEPGPGREDTWLSDTMIDALLVLLEAGWVHSVEAWRADELVGGVYGIAMGRVFFAESMFSRPPAGRDASKVCLVHLWQALQAAGINVLDAQYLTPHLVRMGFVEVPRETFHRAIGVGPRF